MSQPLDTTTSEYVDVLVTTTSDPTAVVPEFSVSKTSAPGTWVAGTWTGAFSATTGEVQGQSPLMGAGEALDVDSRGTWRLWVRWTVGDETPVRVALVFPAI